MFTAASPQSTYRLNTMWTTPDFIKDKVLYFTEITVFAVLLIVSLDKPSRLTG